MPHFLGLLERSVHLGPGPNVRAAASRAVFASDQDPKEVALPDTVRLRGAIRHMPEPSLWPFFTHFCCVAERWADAREGDRAPRSIAEAADATALASEWTST